MPSEDRIASRRRLLSYLEKHPGAHLREIERGARLAVGVLRHHLDYLVESKLVTETRDGRLRRFFPAGLDPELRGALPVLRVHAHRAIVVHLLVHHEADARTLADALHVAPRTAQHYLRRLIDGAAVERVADRYRLAAPGLMLRALVAYRPSFADRLVDAALEVWFDEPR